MQEIPEKHWYPPDAPVTGDVLNIMRVAFSASVSTICDTLGIHQGAWKRFTSEPEKIISNSRVRLLIRHYNEHPEDWPHRTYKVSTLKQLILDELGPEYEKKAMQIIAVLLGTTLSSPYRWIDQGGDMTQNSQKLAKILELYIKQGRLYQWIEYIKLETRFSNETWVEMAKEIDLDEIARISREKHQQ